LGHPVNTKGHFLINTDDFEIELRVGDVVHGDDKYKGVTWEESSFVIALKNNKPVQNAPGLCGLGPNPLTDGYTCKKCQEGSVEAKLCDCDEWYEAATQNEIGMSQLPLSKYSWKDGQTLPAHKGLEAMNKEQCTAFFKKQSFGQKALDEPLLNAVTDWSLGNCAADSASGVSLEEMTAYTADDFCGTVRDMINPGAPSQKLCAVLNLCPEDHHLVECK